MQTALNTRPTKIGEGTYGCVFKPSMNCKSGTIMPPGFNNNDYISKFMKKEYAEDELSEFDKFNQIDPDDKYHLGKQFICDPEINMQEISTCKNLDLNDVMTKPYNYKLLIGKYGGPDLSKFCEKYVDSYFLGNQPNAEKLNKKNKFFLEIRHLLKGLNFFKNNGLVHYDLKPQNILFSLKDGSMKFIDFGLMRQKSQIINDSNQNKNWLGTFHWSYPLDTGFMNKKDFDTIALLSDETINKVIYEFYLQIDSETTMVYGNYPLKKPDSFLHMFKKYLHINTKKNLEPLLLTFKGFFKFAQTNSYDVVLNKIIDSIDVYGLGFSLIYFTVCLHTHGVIDSSELLILIDFLEPMIYLNTPTRNTNIDDLINKYDLVLRQLIPNLCEPNKELNSRTGRCVLKCKPGFTRNSKFQCRKHPKSVTLRKRNPSLSNNFVPYVYVSPVLNSISNIIPSANRLVDFVIQCGPDKDLNPKTKRCVKKCQQGYTRDTNFKCRKGRRTKNR